MLCPYCGEEMEKGYIQTRDMLGWSPKVRALSVFSGFFNDIKFGSAVETYNCKKCMKLILEYTKENLKE